MGLKTLATVEQSKVNSELADQSVQNSPPSRQILNLSLTLMECVPRGNRSVFVPQALSNVLPNQPGSITRYARI